MASADTTQPRFTLGFLGHELQRIESSEKRKYRKSRGEKIFPNHILSAPFHFMSFSAQIYSVIDYFGILKLVLPIPLALLWPIVMLGNVLIAWNIETFE